MSFLRYTGWHIGALPWKFLEHDRSFFLLAGLDNGLEQLHVVYVEAPIAYLLECLGEEFSRVVSVA